MIDWSKYPKVDSALATMEQEDLPEFERLLSDVRRAERERCAEKCRRRAYQHGNPMGTAPQCVADEAFACAADIEAMGDDDE